MKVALAQSPARAGDAGIVLKAFCVTNHGIFALSWTRIQLDRTGIMGEDGPTKVIKWEGATVGGSRLKSEVD